METKKVPYERQIFVCVHNANGEKRSCGDHNGEEVFRQLREIAKARKLHPSVRVAQAKCLGQCDHGVTVMTILGFPKSAWKMFPPSPICTLPPR
jgi:predicted metal-binding protein